MSFTNRDGQAGTVAALRATNPATVAPVSMGLIGPGGGQVEGMDNPPADAAPGAAIDGALADLDARLTRLESAGEG